ncbi:ABC transporter domain-containing protein [Candidatus Hydrogenisulfobacillus filiaventi]|uniref:ABC transporter domain-containing protein n=1 Tax=Candidatus Hydrogenisulfobacillus filiaventi TaxID=2707344 RepID=A0A6F8ZEB8_9FIRM|nr:ATP-binding cassette domain-containing protein [Bacillota bacterium]CAB1127983.1 ABC transporter domain-containing protein [Candidatus Hydrogenisulfobacillus filiaventi]
MAATAARIVVEDLSKRYGALEAVRGVSFSVAPHEVFGFLGPNGAGKTTTIQMLATLLPPSGGRAAIDGLDVVRQRGQVRQRIGLVFQDPTLDERLTGWENLKFHGLLYGLSSREVRERAGPLLEMVGLSDRVGDLVRTYSGGMKRRLELVRGLLHHPKVLFLDEPTVGLDPQTRHQLWEHVVTLARERDTAVFMTTHYMDEAEHCDRVAIMDHGRIVALDSPEALKRQLGQEVIVLEPAAGDAELAGRLQRELGYPVEVQGREVWIHTPDAGAELARVVTLVGRVRRVEVRRPSLEDVFLHLTGRAIREEGPQPPGRLWRRRGA